MSFDLTLREATADIVIRSAINEGQTHIQMLSFDKNAKPYSEDRIARTYGSEALDHFRAIRHHRDALRAILGCHP
jgi:hypothetical protein